MCALCSRIHLETQQIKSKTQSEQVFLSQEWQITKRHFIHIAIRQYIKVLFMFRNKQQTASDSSPVLTDQLMKGCSTQQCLYD